MVSVFCLGKEEGGVISGTPGKSSICVELSLRTLLTGNRERY